MDSLWYEGQHDFKKCLLDLVQYWNVTPNLMTSHIQNLCEFLNFRGYVVKKREFDEFFPLLLFSPNSFIICTAEGKRFWLKFRTCHPAVMRWRPILCWRDVPPLVPLWGTSLRTPTRQPATTSCCPPNLP